MIKSMACVVYGSVLVHSIKMEGIQVEKVYKYQDIMQSYGDMRSFQPSNAKLECPHQQTAYMIHSEVVQMHGKTQSVENLHGIRRLLANCEIQNAMNRMGLFLLDIGQVYDAHRVFQLGIEWFPAASEMYGNIASVYLQLHDLSNALLASKIALKLNPSNGGIHHNIGNIYQEAGQTENAIAHWEQAIKFEHKSPNPWFSLGIVWGGRGYNLKSVEYFKQGLSIARHFDPASVDTAKLQLATAILPRVYMSVEEIQTTRKMYEDSLIDLLRQSPLHLPNPIVTTGCGSMGYYLVYQGFQDFSLRRILSEIYEKSNPRLNFVAPHVELHRSKIFSFPRTKEYAIQPQSEITNRKIRLGVVSSFLFYHSVGLLLQGVLTRLPKDTYDITLFRFPSEEDTITRKILAHVSRDIILPKNIWKAQEVVSQFELDIILFTEIGMDHYTYFLAFSKLALRSILFWGHAVTSAIPSMDYFISSNNFQTQQEHFSEVLYPMESLTVAFERPNFVFDLQLTPFVNLSRTMYLVPQTLYKLHPSMDRIFNAILRQHHNSYIVLLEGATPFLATQVKQRLAQYLGIELIQRIVFAPKLSKDAFLTLCALADVVLDPFPLGGGRSSFEIFSVGSPIVVHEQRTTVLQLTSAMYKKMNITNLICHTDGDYVNTALQIGQNKSFRMAMRQLIQMRSNILFNNSDLILRDWDRCFHEILALPPPPNVVFGVRLDLLGKTMEVVLPRTKTPYLVAMELAHQYNLEPMHQMYIETLLENGKRRWQQPPKLTVKLLPELPSMTFYLGDDIALAVQYFQWKHSLRMPWNTIESLIQQVQDQLGHADSGDEWIAVRQKDYRKELQFPAPADNLQCITVVITTCKRLKLFLSTTQSFLKFASGVSICMILVIDDHSSQDDRIAMEKMHPQMKFIYTTRKGHAHSLNVLLDLVTSRYVLYLEDDWQWFDSLPSHPIKDALSILKSEPKLVQVQLNNQDSGWHRSHYRLHEFGIVSHKFGYWPGFSLNPALWDLDRLRVCGIQFNEHSDIFEREFSLEVWKCGLQVAFLPYTSTYHIGAPPGSNASAYVLNGKPRRFDTVDTKSMSENIFN